MAALKLVPSLVVITIGGEPEQVCAGKRMRVSVVLSLRRKASRLDEYTVPQHVSEPMSPLRPQAIGTSLNVTRVGVRPKGT